MLSSFFSFPYPHFKPPIIGTVTLYLHLLQTYQHTRLSSPYRRIVSGCGQRRNEPGLNFFLLTLQKFVSGISFNFCCGISFSTNTSFLHKLCTFRGIKHPHGLADVFPVDSLCRAFATLEHLARMGAFACFLHLITSFHMGRNISKRPRPLRYIRFRQFLLPNNTWRLCHPCCTGTGGFAG